MLCSANSNSPSALALTCELLFNANTTAFYNNSDSLATPMLARPGAITAVLVWQQRPDIPIGMPLLFTAIITACLSVYFVFYFGVTRLMGLLLAVIAVQFIVSGFQQIR